MTAFKKIHGKASEWNSAAACRLGKANEESNL